MQISRFPDGGFAIHKIPTRAGASRLSAWYDKTGSLLDCESINVLGNSYRPARSDIEHCKRLGPIYATETEGT